jgi:2-polyprenyl-3-methyl-5-hydroxy-6-metoxy-1,4-benzoquinol methylase
MLTESVALSVVLGASVFGFIVLTRQNQPPELQQDTKDLFREYAGIEDEKEIKRRMLKARNIGVNTHGYKCISEYRFISPRCTGHPRYKDIVPRFKNSTILDIGCCMGTDLRKMIVDGAIPENVCGIDIEGTFITLGYDLFDDKAIMHDKFFVMNILDKNNWPTSFRTQLFDIAYCGSVFHLLSEEDGGMLVANLKEMLSDGAVFLGKCVGTSKDHAIEVPEAVKSFRPHFTFMHSAESLRKMLHDNGFKNIEITASASPQEMTVINRAAGLNVLAFYATK